MSLTKVSYSMINGAAVNTKDFGAVGDGVTDDTAAVQAAINYCLSFTSPLVNGQSLIPQLHVSGMCKITASLIIDRPINQTGFFRIIGDGVVGGFVATTAISIFSTSNAFYATDLSNQVSFENLTFQGVADGGTLLIYAIDVHRYVRTYIKGCFFQLIRLNAGTDLTQYTQSLYISDTTVRACPGKWMNSYSYLDVHVTQSIFEGILDTVFYAGGGMYSFTCTDSVLQGNRGYCFNTVITRGVVIQGNYIEDNWLNFVKFDYVSGGTIVSGNVIGTRGSSPSGPDNYSDSTFYEILIGESLGFFGFGNSGLRLYKFTGANRVANIGIGDVVSGTFTPDLCVQFASLINTNYGEMRMHQGQIVNYADNADTYKKTRIYTTYTGLVLEGILNFEGQADDSLFYTMLKVSGKGVGFNGTAPIAKPTVTGSKGGNAALSSLITALSAYGLIIDTTT